MTNGDQSLKELNSLVSWLKKENFKVIQPSYALFPKLLASTSLKLIEQSNIVIADVTAYSHGVGFELGYAYALRKQTIVISNAVAREKLSKFLLGLYPEIVFYEDEKELLSGVSRLLKCLVEKKGDVPGHHSKGNAHLNNA